jgi:GAF domain-containing protein
MSDDRPLEAGFAELSQFFVGDNTMNDTVRRIAELAVESTGAAYAGVTMLVDGSVETGVFTDPTSPEIDRAQYDTGEGPCLDAFRTGEIYRIASTVDDGPWPAFRAACRQHGIASTASFPIEIDNVRHGALNLYATTVDAFTSDEIHLGRSFAAQAGVVMAYARSYWNAKTASEHLEAALAHRAEIEQAKGIIIGATGATPDEAFEILVKQSQHENRKLRDVAIDLVNSKVRRAKIDVPNDASTAGTGEANG